MDQCGPCLKRRRHDSEQSVSSGTSSCSALEYTDLEAAEALVCMSSWGQPVFLGGGGGGGNKLNTCKPRPLTPASDSCDSLLPLELQESPRDFVSLSSLVRACQTNKPIKSQFVLQLHQLCTWIFYVILTVLQKCTKFLDFCFFSCLSNLKKYKKQFTKTYFIYEAQEKNLGWATWT